MNEDQKTLLLQNKINLRFYEQDPFYILQMKVLAPPRPCTWSIMCQKTRKKKKRL